MSSSKYLIVITGPTGIGKTELSLRLNDIYNTSIISADSRQVYKEMSIGTAKPSQQEITDGNIKLVNYISVTEEYNAGSFEKDAIKVVNQDHAEGNISIICGGTGLYIKAVTEGLNEYPDIPKAIIKNIESELKDYSIEALQKRLLESDPQKYANIDIQNSHRLIRALSIIDHTGRPFSEFQAIELEPRPFKLINVVLDDDREVIYKRVEQRVDKMIASGLIEEVESLIQYKDLKALNTVGYSEVFQYLDGHITKEFCISEIKKNTRRYAKRQLTWLRKFNDGKRFLAGDFDGVKHYVEQELGRY